MAMVRILVVEDERLVADDVKDSLEASGYSVVGVATSGQAAIEQAEATRPDLVVMDIKLRGEMDGVEAGRQIRQRLDIPTVYLTAFADRTTLQRTKIAEPYGYVVKPFEQRELHGTIQMALYRHRMELRLRERERWLDTVLRSINDAVIVSDDRGRVKFMNPVAEELTGWTQAEALGQDLQTVFVLIDEETRVAVGPATRAQRDNGAPAQPARGLLVTKDGTEMPIGQSLAAIRDAKGGLSGAVLVFRDVTERRREEQAMVRQIRELEARNEELSSFAHGIAHELQSPLTIACGFLEFLRDSYVTMADDEVGDYLNVIERNLRTMSAMMSELLLLAEVRSADVEVVPLNMAGVVSTAQQRVSHLIGTQKAELSLPTVWPGARGCALWVEEVWVSYLRHGLTFGGRPPRLQLGANRQPDGMVRFWVRDNGPGLTQEAQARLFAPTERFDRVPARGLGLGLCIARSVVERLGGQVGVESQAGLGSLLFFTLPAIAG